MQQNLYHLYHHEQPDSSQQGPDGIWKGAYSSINQAVLAVINRVIEKISASPVIKPFCEVMSLTAGDGRPICSTRPHPDGTLRLHIEPASAPGLKVLVAAALNKDEQRFTNEPVIAFVKNDLLTGVPLSTYFLMQELSNASARLQNLERFPFIVETIGWLAKDNYDSIPVQQVDYFSDKDQANLVWQLHQQNVAQHKYPPDAPAIIGARIAHAPTGITDEQLGNWIAGDFPRLPLPYQAPQTSPGLTAATQQEGSLAEPPAFTVTESCQYFPPGFDTEKFEWPANVTIQHNFADVSEALVQLMTTDLASMARLPATVDGYRHCVHAAVVDLATGEDTALIAWGQELQPMKALGINPKDLSPDSIYLAVDTGSLPPSFLSSFPIELKQGEPFELAWLQDGKLIPNPVALLLQAEILGATYGQPSQEMLSLDTAPFIVEYHHQPGASNEYRLKQVPALSLADALALVVGELGQSFSDDHSNGHHIAALKAIRVIEAARGIPIAQLEVDAKEAGSLPVLTVAAAHVSAFDLQKLQAVYQPVKTVPGAAQLIAIAPVVPTSVQAMSSRNIQSGIGGQAPTL